MPPNLADFRLKIAGNNRPEKPKLSSQLAALMPSNLVSSAEKWLKDHPEKPKLSFRLSTLISPDIGADKSGAKKYGARR